MMKAQKFNQKENIGIISIVAPVMDEEGNIQTFVHRIDKVFKTIPSFEYEILFVNDASRDNSLKIMLDLRKNNKKVKILDFSRNFGKEAAISAGLDYAAGDAVIVIDVDLQDPPELIAELYKKWVEGFDVVVARRRSRKSDSFFKKKSAEWFYKIFNKISETKLATDVGDYRLFDRKVVEAILRLRETNRFMKGIFAWVGFDTAYVDYDREARTSGATKFSTVKLWNYGLLGITSFSTVPIKFWSYVGTLLSALALIVGIKIAITKLLFGNTVDGYSSIMVAVTFLGGIQLIGIGVLGEYLGRMYIETKSRPLYLIKDLHE